MTRRLLAIYLQDHRAGATVGVELSKRIRDAEKGTPLGAAMAEIATEIEQDVDTLDRLMVTLEVSKDRLKMAGGWTGEKLGRLKLNGRLLSASPLSRVVELEGLSLGIEGKRSLWRALDGALGGSVPGFDFKALAARAAIQRESVETFRLAAAKGAFEEESSLGV